MSKKDRDLVKQLDKKISLKYKKKLTIGAVVMIIAVLMHDGDHIRVSVQSRRVFTSPQKGEENSPGKS